MTYSTSHLSVLILVVFLSTGCITSNPDDHKLTQFTVSGTVTGLTGELRLFLNNTDQVKVNEVDNEFTFNLKLMDKDRYDVTLGTPPDQLQCQVTSGSLSGNIDNKNVNIIIACGPGSDKASLSFPFTTQPTESPYQLTVATGNDRQFDTFSNKVSTRLDSELNGAASNQDAFNTIHYNQNYDLNGYLTGLLNDQILKLILTVDDQITRVSLSAQQHNFSFEDALTIGQNYQLSVDRNPNHQLCEINNGSGQVTGPSIPTVSIYCRSWGIAQPFGRANAKDATHVRVTFLPTTHNYFNASDALAVWQQQSDNGASTIRSRVFLATDERWLAGTNISTADALNPEVSASESGEAIAIWEQGGYIHAAHFTDDQQWQPSVQIGGHEGENKHYPKIGMDAEGNALATWVRGPRYEGDISRIAASIYDANPHDPGWVWPFNMIFRESKIATVATPQVAMSKNGFAIIAWLQNLPGQGLEKTRIYSERYQPGRDYGWDQIHFTGPKGSVGDADKVQVAIDDEGNILAVWQQKKNNNIYARYYPAAEDVWRPIVLLSNSNRIARSPQVAFSSSGNAVAVWEQSDIPDNPNADYSIYASRYLKETDSWSASPTPVELASGDANSAQVAVDPSGQAIIVWRQFNGSSFAVFSNHFSTNEHFDLGLGGTQISSLTNHDYVDKPQLAIDDDGNALVVWSLLKTANQRAGLYYAYFR